MSGPMYAAKPPKKTPKPKPEPDQAPEPEPVTEVTEPDSGWSRKKMEKWCRKNPDLNIDPKKYKNMKLLYKAMRKAWNALPE